jgi:putative DNA primase/helicase
MSARVLRTEDPTDFRVPPDKPLPLSHSRAGLVCAADIKPEPVSWLWHGWIAKDVLHILAGAPGTGKTTVALAVAATISRGGRWPDGSLAEIGDVLIWSGEDVVSKTLVPRLIAMGADLSRVRFIETAQGEDGRRPFDPATDIGQLEAAIQQLGFKPSLLIVDPIVSAVAGDSHKNGETRRALQPLVDLAESAGSAVLGISHFSKGTAGRDVVERVTGSLAFGALARVVLGAAKMPDKQGGGRLIARAKSNIGPDGGAYRYDLQQIPLPEYPEIPASCVLWGESIEGTARDILAQAEVMENPEERSAIDDAKGFLGMLLERAPMPQRQLRADADGAGHAWATVRRAAKALNVEIYREGFGKEGVWLWKLPPIDAQKLHTCSHKSMSTFEENEHLCTVATPFERGEL